MRNVVSSTCECLDVLQGLTKDVPSTFFTPDLHVHLIRKLFFRSSPCRIFCRALTHKFQQPPIKDRHVARKIFESPWCGRSSQSSLSRENNSSRQ